MFKPAEQLRSASNEAKERIAQEEAKPHVEAISNMLEDAANVGFKKAVYVSDIPNLVLEGLENAEYSLFTIQYHLPDEEINQGLLIDWGSESQSRSATIEPNVAYVIGDVHGHRKIETGISYEVI